MNHFATVCYTIRAEKDFERLRARGLEYTADEILWDVVDYITAHEKAGIRFDTDGQALDYDHVITLELRKVDGIWYIERILVRRPVRRFEPMYLWRSVRNNLRVLAERLFVGWKVIRSTDAFDPYSPFRRLAV